MTELVKDKLARKALKTLNEERLESFIDTANISEEDLKKALLTAVDIDILQHEYQVSTKNNKITKG